MLTHTDLDASQAADLALRSARREARFSRVRRRNSRSVAGDRLGALIRIQATLSLAVDELRDLPDAPEEHQRAVVEVLDWAKTEVALALREAGGRRTAD